MKKLILILAALFVLGGSVFLWYLSPPFRAEEVRLTIPAGSTGRHVIHLLEQANIIRSPSAFLILSRLTGQTNKFKKGIYSFQPGMWAPRVLYTVAKGLTYKIKVTFPEGWTVKQMGVRLEEAGICSSKEFQSRANFHEGYLFPSTYYFEPGTSVDEVIETLVGVFEGLWPEDGVAKAEKLNLTRHQVVILASIVEREAKKDGERPLVGAVFLNRLKKKWRLESCATVQYALGGWKERLLYRDLNVDSPYNTYRHRGLPPGPIGNPGHKSIQAVLNPVESDALFFLSDGEGTHQFYSSYKDHLKGVAQRNKERVVKKKAAAVVPQKKEVAPRRVEVSTPAPAVEPTTVVVEEIGVIPATGTVEEKNVIPEMGTVEDRGVAPLPGEEEVITPVAVEGGTQGVKP